MPAFGIRPSAFDESPSTDAGRTSPAATRWCGPSRSRRRGTCPAVGMRRISRMNRRTFLTRSTALLAAAARTRAAETSEHVTVWREANRYGGWPANHGIWSWGDEILVGFTAGVLKTD